MFTEISRALGLQSGTTSTEIGKTMSEAVTLHFSTQTEPLGVLTVEWWDENSKYVVVCGSKDEEDFALRLDLDKHAFLDHAKNSRTDELVQSLAPDISRLVWTERSKLTTSA